MSRLVSKLLWRGDWDGLLEIGVGDVEGMCSSLLFYFSFFLYDVLV